MPNLPERSVFPDFRRMGAAATQRKGRVSPYDTCVSACVLVPPSCICPMPDARCQIPGSPPSGLVSMRGMLHRVAACCTQAARTSAGGDGGGGGCGGVTPSACSTSKSRPALCGGALGGGAENPSLSPTLIPSIFFIFFWFLILKCICAPCPTDARGR